MAFYFLLHWTIISFLVQLILSQSECCPVFYRENPQTHKWWLIETVLMNWTDAKTSCEKHDGVLGNLANQLDKDFILKQWDVLNGSNDNTPATLWVSKATSDTGCPRIMYKNEWSWNSGNCSKKKQSLCMKVIPVNQSSADNNGAEKTYANNELSNIYNELSGNTTDRSAIESSLERLQNITAPVHASLSAADLEIVSSILDGIVNAIGTSNHTVPDIIAEGFLQSASNFIDDIHNISWSKIEPGDNHVPNLLKSVESFGKVYSTRMTESDEVKSIVSPNIVLQAKKSKPKTIVFPEEAKGVIPRWVFESSGSVTVKKSTLEGLYDDEQDLFFSAIFYKNIQTILPNAEGRDDLGNFSVNSKVLAITVSPPAPKILNPPISIRLQHTHGDYSDPKCAFWEFDAKFTGGWSTRGCRPAKSSDDETQCLCDHMTNFAVLMSPGRAGDTNTKVLSIISLAGCCLSIFGLVITMFVYFFLWKFLNKGRAVLLMNLCFALLIAYVVFLVGVTQTETKDVCTAVAVLLHYFYLAAFFFMLAEGIDIVVGVVFVFAKKSRSWKLWKLVLLGWGAPLVIVGVAMSASQLNGYGSEDYCWLSTENSLIWAFVGPVLLIIMANAIFTAKILRALYSTAIVSNRSAREKAITGIRSICVLLPVLGLTWVFGVFSANEDLVVFQYLFATCNSVQGLLIFVLYCATDKQVKDGFTRWRQSRLRKKGSSFDMKTSVVSNLESTQSAQEIPI